VFLTVPNPGSDRPWHRNCLVHKSELPDSLPLSSISVDQGMFYVVVDPPGPGKISGSMVGVDQEKGELMRGEGGMLINGSRRGGRNPNNRNKGEWMKTRAEERANMEYNGSVWERR